MTGPGASGAGGGDVAWAGAGGGDVVRAGAGGDDVVRAGAGGAEPNGHGLAGTADAGAFLVRLVRLDRAAVVRLRSTGATRSTGSPGAAQSVPVSGGGSAVPTDRTTLWARLPWGVLVSRTVPGPGAGDVTVAAAELLDLLGRGGGTLPSRRDGQWRWPLPPAASRLVERIPGGDLRRIAEAAAGTLRSAAEQGVGGRAVGQRALRDALLDHVAVVVTPDEAAPASGERIEVSQRLIQGVLRMGFLGPGGERNPDEVRVRVAGRWVGLEAPYGSAWSQTASALTLTPTRDHPNG